MPDNQNRDVAANNVIVTLDGKELPRPLSVSVGNNATYQSYDENAHPSFVSYRPTTLHMTFPVTKNETFRKIGGSEAAMKRDYQMVVRFMAADDTPLTVTNLQNVRFTSIVQVHSGGGRQPIEEVIAMVEEVTYDN